MMEPAQQGCCPDAQLNDGDMEQNLIIQGMSRIQKQQEPDIRYQVNHPEQCGNTQDDERPVSHPGFVENQQKQLGKDNREYRKPDGMYDAVSKQMAIRDNRTAQKAHNKEQQWCQNKNSCQQQLFD